MPAKPLRLDYTPQGGRQFEGIERALSGVGDTRITNGRLLEVALTATAQNVSHGLGKKWSGWFFVNKALATDAFSTPSTDDTKFLNLTGTVPTTVSIWVF